MAEHEEIDKIKKEQKNDTLSEKLKVLLKNEELTDKMIQKKPEWLKILTDNAPMTVIAGSLIAEAMAGDKTATSLINKIAYGDQVTLNAGQGFFDSNEIKIEIINPEHKENEDFKETEWFFIVNVWWKH